MQRQDTIVLPKADIEPEFNFTDSAMIPVVVAKKRPFSSQPFGKPPLLPTTINSQRLKQVRQPSQQMEHGLSEKRKLLLQASEIIAQSKLYKSDTQQVTKYLISLLGEEKEVLTKVT